MIISRIKAYLLAAGAVVIAVLLFIVRSLSRRNAKLEHDNAIHETAKQIEIEQNRRIDDILTSEQRAIERKTDRRVKSVTDINSL